MGLTKNYLRYVHSSTFGLVAASNQGSSIRFVQIGKTTDRYVAVPANENVYIWDLKTKNCVQILTYEGDQASEVTTLDVYCGGNKNSNLIATGYANGSIRVFEYESGILKSTFTGHRSAVSCLTFDANGARLASGGKDCQIILWDIVADQGLFSLKGHKNAVTKLCFVYNEEYHRDLLVSSCVDAVSTLKFWDLQIQHCFWTESGHSSGIWSFVMFRQGTRIVCGSIGPQLKVYSIEYLDPSTSKKLQDSSEDNDHGLEESEIEFGVKITPMKSILRHSESVSKRIQDMSIDKNESIIICHSNDKTIEFYGIRSEAEALSYAKRKVKKENRKAIKRKNDHNDEPTIETQASITAEEFLKTVECEINLKYKLVKSSYRVKATAIISTNRDTRKYRVACMLANNKLEYFTYEPECDQIENQQTAIDSIEIDSHRSEVQCVALSPDNHLIMSGSGESIKIWRRMTQVCISTIPSEPVTCCAFANLDDPHDARFHYAFVGTKTGSIQIVDARSASIVETIEAYDSGKSLASIDVLPDGSGIVTGGQDQTVASIKFWTHSWIPLGMKAKVLSLTKSRTLPIERETIITAKISKNSKFLAVALSDSRVEIFFVDTFKHFLSLYGHKLPVTCLDISDDSTIIATGSSDKNIKIWGLDFGDCHKSIFAHDDIITCLKFVPKTHYVFTASRDKTIKQWDCDHFGKIQTIRSHQAEIWCMDLSSSGNHIVTASHDKSLRLFEKTEEILIPEEDEADEREAEDERNIFEKQENIIAGELNKETGLAAKKTVESVKSTDRLIEAIEVFGNEQAKHKAFEKAKVLAAEKNEPEPAAPEPDPLLMSANTTDYHRFMLEILRRIKGGDLEEILLTLEFDYVHKLLIILTIFMEKNWDIELMVRCACFLLRVNSGRIMASPTLVPVIYKLRNIIMDRTMSLKDMTGFNLFALKCVTPDK